MPFFNAPPLSLYVHLPWCISKCPYCDFNSHVSPTALPEAAYVQVLLGEMAAFAPLVKERPVISIFFGGGTPSLFSAASIAQILEGAAKHFSLAMNVEITLEANPGTVDQARFAGFKAAGINRLSLGVQSLDDQKLKALGRIHDQQHAIQAIKIARDVGFENLNIDIMYGLMQQSADEALKDVEAALAFAPTHFSWYQLTIEPNTVFYRQQPTLPTDDTLWEMQTAGQALLQSKGYAQYEVSAYSLPNQQCLHNLNYWEFGDYLGLGAGAHSKLTDVHTGKVIRYAQVKQPQSYLIAAKHPENLSWGTKLTEQDLIFEFMLNALRLSDGVPVKLFTEHTGITFSHIEPILKQAQQQDLLLTDTNTICPTEKGKRYLNNLISLFLP